MRRIIKTVRSVSVIPIIFLLLGLGLRLFPFFTKSFWEDEMYSYFFATQPKSFLEYFRAPPDDRPPLFYLIVKAVTFIGTQEKLLRLPGLIFSVLALYILYRAFKKIHTGAALTVLFLSACSLFQIDMTWELRDYVVQIFVSSVIIYLVVRFFQNLYTRSALMYRYYVFLGIASTLGCLLNHIFIPFVIAVHGLLALFWIIFARKKRLFGSILFILAIVPPLLTSGYFLHKQTSVMRDTVLWIPQATTLSYLSLPPSFLGFSKNFDVTYYEDQDLLYGAINQNIEIILVLYVLFIICFMNRKKETVQYNTVILFIVFGFLVSVLDVVGISIASRILGHELFVPRAFTPAQVIFLASVGALVGLVLGQSGKTKYMKAISIVGAIVYMSVFWNIYFDLYAVIKTNTFKMDSRDEMMAVARKNYSYGDQVIIDPLYLRDSYLNYLWRKEKNKNYDILATALLHNKATPQTLRQISMQSHNPKIVFIIDVRLLDPSKKDIFSDYWWFPSLANIKEAKTFCLGPPTEKLHNDAYIVSVCPMFVPK